MRAKVAKALRRRYGKRKDVKRAWNRTPRPKRWAMAKELQ